MKITRCLGCFEPLPDGATRCENCDYLQSSAPSRPYALCPGTILKGRYLVGQVIGAGGFGITYIAYDLVLEKKVAIKEYMPREFSTRATGELAVSVYTGPAQRQFVDGLERFQSEAKRLAALESVPAVVKIFDTFPANQTAYIVMEYLEGVTVKKVLAKQGTFEYAEAERIILSLSDTLSKVHKTGIFHRDISPDNIFLTNDGGVKLLDFGAAKYATVTYSRSLSIVLKHGYAPEEQYRSHGRQGPWSDVYSTAATMYKMITGHTPQNAMARTGHDELVAPSKLGADIPPNKETALMNALVIDGEQRTQSIDVFIEELTGGDRVKPIKATPKNRDEGRWPRWLKLSAVVAAAAMVAVIAVVIVFKSEPPTPSDWTYMPNIIGLTAEEAKTKLAERGLNIYVAGTIDLQYGESNVIQQCSPAVGSLLKVNSSISVYIGRNETLYLQDYSYMDADISEQMITEKGLFVTREYVETTDYASGTVMQQSVPLDTAVPRNSLIKLTVARNTAASGSASAPDITGKTLDDATAALKKAGLCLAAAEWRFSEQPIGTVISQITPAGQQLAAGTGVQAILSAGKRFLRVPELYLDTLDEALKLMDGMGLKYTIEADITEEYAEDLITGQSSEAGTRLEGDNCQITIKVAKPLYGNVPDLRGMTLEEATLGYAKAGYTVKLVGYSNTPSYAYGTVCLQNSYGGPVARTKPVEIEISNCVNYGSTDILEQVVGMRTEDATRLLEAAGYNVHYSSAFFNGSYVESAALPYPNQKNSVRITPYMREMTVNEYNGWPLADAVSALRGRGIRNGINVVYVDGGQSAHGVDHVVLYENADLYVDSLPIKVFVFCDYTTVFDDASGRYKVNYENYEIVESYSQSTFEASVKRTADVAEQSRVTGADRIVSAADIVTGTEYGRWTTEDLSRQDKLVTTAADCKYVNRVQSIHAGLYRCYVSKDRTQCSAEPTESCVDLVEAVAEAAPSGSTLSCKSTQGGRDICALFVNGSPADYFSFAGAGQLYDTGETRTYSRLMVDRTVVRVVYYGTWEKMTYKNTNPQSTDEMLVRNVVTTKYLFIKHRPVTEYIQSSN